MKKVLVTIFIVFSFVLSINSKVNAATPSLGLEYVSYISQAPNNTLFDNSTRVENGIASTRKVTISQGWYPWDTKHGNITDLVYVVFKFNNPANARIRKLLDPIIYLTQGATFTHSTSFNKGYTYTYEEEMTAELNTRYGTSTELSVSGINYGAVEVGGKVSVYAEVETKVSQTVKETKTYTYSTTETYTQSVVAPESAYYVYEERGNFHVYVIQVYKAQYNIVSSKHKNWAGYTWTEYDHQIKGYTLLEQTVYYNYIDDTLSKGYFRYALRSDGKFIYNDLKTTGIAYL